MADSKPKRWKKWIAALTVITAAFTVACEAEEEPDTDVDVTEPADDGADTTETTSADTTETTEAEEETTTTGG